MLVRSEKQPGMLPMNYKFPLLSCIVGSGSISHPKNRISEHLLTSTLTNVNDYQPLFIYNSLHLQIEKTVHSSLLFYGRRALGKPGSEHSKEISYATRFA